MIMTFKLFGHRGYPARFPENSLAGFRYAAAHHFAGVETDVQFSRDGALIVMHDECLDRTTNGHGQLHDYTLAQLRQFHLANGEPVPTLAEVLTIFAGSQVALNIEFKTGNLRYSGIEAATQAAVVAHDCAAQTLYSSFNPDSLVTIAKIAPQQERALLVEGNAIPAWGQVGQLVTALHSDTYFPDLAVPQRLWTINDPIQMQHLASQPGVIGLITDRYEQASELVPQARTAVAAS